MDQESRSRESCRRPGSPRPGHPPVCRADPGGPGRFMLQEASARGGEVDQAWAGGEPRKAPPASIASSLRTWLPVTAATAICLGIHWYVSQSEAPAETRSYFVFLWSVLGVSIVLAVVQIGWPSLRRWMREMGPIFAAALLTLCGW